MSKERIDKIMSNLGLMSRSDCKKMVKNGLITINGVVVNRPEEKADPETDEICFKNQKINTSKYVYYMLYKPAGVITATHDDEDKTVMDLIDDNRTDLAAVGRLDKDTTGILLITNDGQLNHRLVSPKNHVTKRYEVLIDGVLSQTDIDLLTQGMDIGDDKPTLPAKLEIITNEKPQSVALSITEGRYHQVKRMFAKVNCPVLRLHRSHFGEVALDEKLSPGEYRQLTKSEIESLLK